MLRRWEALPIDLTDVAPVAEALRSLPATTLRALAGPVFARATFDLAADIAGDSTDLYLDTAGWGKGVVWINGFNLGRYWSRGPQRTLYVPGPILREGENEVVVLELQASATPVASFVSRHDLGHIET